MRKDSPWLVVLMMHNLRKGGAIPLDALLSIRAMAQEVTQAGYQFLISFQVKPSSQTATLPALYLGCRSSLAKQSRLGSISSARESWRKVIFCFPAGSYQHILPEGGPCGHAAAVQQGTHLGTAAP